MTLLKTVPNDPADPDIPFLLGVNFDKYAGLLAGISGEAGDPTYSVNAGVPAHIDRAAKSPQLTRYVGLSVKLTELHTVLASAGVNSMWIRGEPGTGKTALVDELIRARTEKRLSSAMLGGPFYLFNVSLFLTGPPNGWVDSFNQCLAHVERNHGLLIIDHIDDLVRAAGDASDRMMQSLIACLESSDDFQAIIISDNKNKDALANAATGILRCFQVMELEEPSLDRVKPILMSHFRMLSKVHDIDYSEAVADEIIRLLGRYPGRAFTSSRRPENAIAFADKVGAMVRINVFAEPIMLAELRDQMGALRDRLDVTARGNSGQCRRGEGDRGPAGRTACRIP